MKNRVLATFLLCSVLLFPQTISAFEFNESFFLKITVIENGTEHEWEYTNPGKFEYEKGEKVLKNNVAKDEMTELVRLIQLTEKSKIENIVEVLKSERFPKLERVDIRWMNSENKLFTWVWEDQ